MQCVFFETETGISILFSLVSVFEVLVESTRTAILWLSNVWTIECVGLWKHILMFAVNLRKKLYFQDYLYRVSSSKFPSSAAFVFRLYFQRCRPKYHYWTNSFNLLRMLRHCYPPTSIFFSNGATSPSGQDLVIGEASRSHSDTPHSVGFLSTSDQPDAKTTWQHTTFTRDKHSCPRRDSNPQSPQAGGRRPTP